MLSLTPVITCASLKIKLKGTSLWLPLPTLPNQALLPCVPSTLTHTSSLAIIIIDVTALHPCMPSSTGTGLQHLAALHVPTIPKLLVLPKSSNIATVKSSLCQWDLGYVLFYISCNNEYNCVCMVWQNWDLNHSQVLSSICYPLPHADVALYLCIYLCILKFKRPLNYIYYIDM